jgi:hypothetical protein
MAESGSRKWARARGAGAHGLRRGCWYLVVNDTQQSVVILNVRKQNVPVPRSMLDVRSDSPDAWSVVRWQESQRGAKRASQERLGLEYGVCPACGERAPLDPPKVPELTCTQCGGTFAVDWGRPC